MTIETKYNIGQEVFWAGYNGDWHYGKIIGIFIVKDKIMYILPELKTKKRTYAIYINESELFSTKEELLKSL